jgi:hypothetical protein
LAVTSHGYVPVQSAALTSLGSRVGGVIHYDIMLPTELKQISPNNYGTTQLYLNSSSLGLNNTYLGQVELTPLPLGQWNTVTFTPTSSVLAKFRGTYTDLRVTIVVNAPYNATKPYLLDNLRFSDSTLALVTVVDSSGKPISGLTVVAYNGSTSTSNTGVTDSTGLAKVWVPPGSYRFGVTDAGVTTYSSVDNRCQVPGICTAVTITDRCHNVVCTAKDTCHNAGICDSGTGLCSNPAKPTGTVCRAVAGPCDVAEVCDGTDAGCPADGFLLQGVVCRAPAGVCDVGEVCSGTSAACPVDKFASSSSVCRPSTGPCDPAENCTGSDPNCPADVLSNSTTLCRAKAGACDVAEYCTGANPACPIDSLMASSNVCRPSAGVCDPAENCTGSDPNCPADVLSNSATLCRAKAGACDVAEYCTGASPACPIDSFMASSNVCRPSAGVCDPAENCTGSDPNCPADVLSNSTTLCRAKKQDCDAAEYCTGASPACPPDVLADSTTICWPSAGPCDLSGYCTGTSLYCPPRHFAPESTVCSDDGTHICDGAGHCVSQCGAVAEPEPHEVMVFKDMNFGGACKTFTVDENQFAYTYIPDLSTYGLNDCISSLKVGSRARLHAFINDNFGGYVTVYNRDPDDIRRNGYLAYSWIHEEIFPGGPPIYETSTYDIGDNPIDIASIQDDDGPCYDGTRYADQATYDSNARPRTHAQMGPNIADRASSLIIDNLDVVGNAEPLIQIPRRLSWQFRWSHLLDRRQRGTLPQP